MHQLFFPYILQETWLLSLTTSVALKSDNISCEGLNHKQTQIISKAKDGADIIYTIQQHSKKEQAFIFPWIQR